MTLRDRQRARVYAWEDETIAPRCFTSLPYCTAQGVVDGIWAELGWHWPPEVKPLPRQSRSLLGQGSRLTLRLPDPVPVFLLLHELAHALSSTAAGESDGHGPRFVGLYLQLLVRYLRLPEVELLTSLEARRIAVDPMARPVFA